MALAAGSQDTCALLTDSSVKCWGMNAFGEIGDGTKIARTSPTAVPGLSGVVAVTVGSAHTCALLAGGSLDCWGHNSYGQLGDGTTVDRYSPTPVIWP